MEDEILRKRERGFEEDWANRRDRELIEKLRKRGSLDEIGMALAVKLQAEDPVLLQRARDLGVTLETGAAFLLAPLVQVAWAEGSVTEEERATVLRLAVARGIATDSPAYAQLAEWLQTRPSDELFETAIDVIKAGIAVLSPAEREERIAVITKGCREVAGASGNLWRRLGLSSGVSEAEQDLLGALRGRLRG